MNLLPKFEDIREAQEYLNGSYYKFNKEIGKHYSSSSVTGPLSNNLLERGYKLLDLIGVGGYSYVYLGEDLRESIFSKRKYVAIVVPKPHKKDKFSRILEAQREHLLEDACILYEVIEYESEEEGKFLYIQVEELLTPLTSFSISRSNLREQLYETTSRMFDEGYVYTDVQLSNMAVNLRGDLKFIDLESIVTIQEAEDKLTNNRKTSHLYDHFYHHLLEDIDSLYIE